MSTEDELFRKLKRPSIAEMDAFFKNTPEKDMGFRERLEYVDACGWERNEFWVELDAYQSRNEQ